jgi:hypothetical protein
MKNTNKMLIGYTIAVFISLFAYESYSAFLSHYNLGFALAAFEFLSFLTLRFLYPVFEAGALKRLKVPDDGFKISPLAAFKKRPGALVLLSLLNFGQFAIMLPFLSTPKNAMMFVLFYSISSVAKIPLAKRLFGDKIANPLAYNIGLVIIVFAGLAIQANGSLGSNGVNISLALLGALMLKAVFNITDSIIERRITSPEHAGEARLSVAAVEETKTYFTVAAGLLTGVCLYLYMPAYHRLVPTATEFCTILFIGVICSLMATLGVRLINIISHIKSQPIQAIRPLIAFLPLLYTYFRTGAQGTEVTYQAVCLIFIVAGILICLRSTNPTTKLKTN